MTSPNSDDNAYHFKAKARLMLLLGDQLITNEVAAVSELIKNSYDADAKNVTVSIVNSNDPSKGVITIKDDGNGMEKGTLLTGWLEIATTNKSRKKSGEPRFSPLLKRTMLGEKGLGRLSVHKLGRVTQIVSRARSTPENYVEKEVVLQLNWDSFDDYSKDLEDVPIKLFERVPEVFIDNNPTTESNHGTLITIKSLQRSWSESQLKELYMKSQLISSPVAGIRDFVVSTNFDGLELESDGKIDYDDIFSKSIYSLVGEIKSEGVLEYTYKFSHPSHPELKRTESGRTILLQPDDFPENRIPACGPFKLTFHSWELTSEDKRLLFGSVNFFRDVVEKQTGVKVYRDGFRVLPYGDEGNDWLGLDQRRNRRFALHIGRNQLIGFIDITSKRNPDLVDKSDREGLIHNKEYNDFHSLVIGAINVFENWRSEDREKIKKLEGRSVDERQKHFTKSLNKLQAKFNEPEFQRISNEKRLELLELVTETRNDFEELAKEREQPLLVAAGIGLSILIPSHEARRATLEGIKLLRIALNKDPESAANEEIKSALNLLKRVDEVIGGLVKLQQRSGYDETFPIDRAIDFAELLYKNRLSRRQIILNKELRIKKTVKGSSRQLALVIENLIDNSSYWLQMRPPDHREIKIITDYVQGNPAIIVSDNGPGIEDELEAITLPFVTRKPKGLGLGLFISSRIAENHDAKLVLLDGSEIVGLLNGANIAIMFPKSNKEGGENGGHT